MTPHRDHGFTLIELLIVVAIISIIAAVAVPGLLKARMAGNETSAIASLRMTMTAQVGYAATCGGGGYAASYLILGTPVVAGSEGFISADLGSVAAPVKAGFIFTVGPGAGNAGGPPDCLAAANATNTTYYATGIPQTYGSTGERSFAVNQSNTVWQIGAAAAPTEPFSAPATPIR